MSNYSLKKSDYLSARFKPEQVANTLIRDTTTPQDTVVDVTAALTRLKYDLEEIDDQMKELCRNNTEVLLEHSHDLLNTSNEIDSLNPVVDDMLSTYSKLERDFLKPYQRAVQLRSNGEKLFVSWKLAHNLSCYLYLAMQAQSQDYQRNMYILTKEAGEIMLRAARAIVSLKELVMENPDLLKLKTVVSFEEKIPKLKTDLISNATKMIQELQGDDNSDQIKHVCATLIKLDVDLRKIVESHIRALVGSSVLQLTRNNSATPAGHTKAFADVQDRESIVSQLTSHYKEVVGAEEPQLDGVKMYWDLIASQLDQKFKTMSLVNPTTMKMFISNKDSILASTQAVEGIHAVFKKYLDK